MLIKQPHGFTTSRQSCRSAHWHRGRLIVNRRKAGSDRKMGYKRANPWSLNKANLD